MTPELARAGRIAADVVLKDLFGLVPLAKANPLSPSGFDAVVLEALGALKEAAKPTEKKAMKAMLQALERQWGGMTVVQQTKAIDEAAEKYLAIARDIGPTVSPVLKDQGSAIVVATKEAANKQFKLGIHPSFDLIDERAVDFASQSQGNFIRTAQGTRAVQLSDVARKVVAQGITEGLDRYEIGKRLGEQLNQTDAARSDAYWRFIASTFVARSRSYSTLRGFDEAGIASYQWESVRDEITTEVCRFMHGRVFPVAGALKSFTATESLQDPEDIKDTQPWAGVGKTADGATALYYKQGDKRRLMAVVDEPGVGAKDKSGTYSRAMSSEQLSAAGLTSPPLHGHCRSALLPVFGVATSIPEPAPPPAAPPPAAPPALAPPTKEAPAALPENLADLVRPLPIEGDFETVPAAPAKVDLVKEALAKLEATPGVSWNPKIVPAPMIPPTISDEGKIVVPYKKVTSAKYNDALKAAPQSIPVASIVSQTMLPLTLRKDVELAILGQSTLSPFVVVKVGDKYYRVNAAGNANSFIMAASLKGDTMVNAHVINGDAPVKKPKAPPKVKPVALTPALPPPLPPPPEVKAPLPKAPPPTDADNILHEEVGAARGSNKGGFFLGKDGVKRYVKFYDDPTQAYSEHLANRIYRDLGLGAPESETFVRGDGTIGYASRIFEGGKTLKEAGLDKAKAKKFMEGFVGDVLTGNWDAVGTGYDNAMVLKNGAIARIDNGGTFLFRAKAGRKPPSVLNEISEWDRFFDSKTNTFYASTASKAGIGGPDDMKDQIKSGVAAVKALRDKSGGWGAYVDQTAPKMKAPDKKAIVEMLDARTNLLEQKVAGFDKPVPAPRTRATGGARADAQQISTVTPRKGLKATDLPEHTEIARIRQDHATCIARGVLPDTGEKITTYQKRTRAELAKVEATTRASIKDFTNGTYGSVRSDEEAGKPDGRSHSIARAFEKVDGEARTVYRGVTAPAIIPQRDWPKWSAEMLKFHLENETWGLGRDGKTATSSTSWNVSRALRFASADVDSDGAKAHRGFAVLYKIKNKTGIAIETNTHFPDEREILAPRTARYRTTGLSWAKGGASGQTHGILIVEAEEID